MALNKTKNTASKKLEQNTITSRPYSSPNTSASNSSRPYSSPNAATVSRPANLPSSLPTGSAYSTIARNTTPTVAPTTPTQVASQAAVATLNRNTAPAVTTTSNYVAPSVPTPSISSSAPSSNPVGNALSNLATPVQTTPNVSDINDLANISLNNSRPTTEYANLNPSQRTDLMLSLLGSPTAESRLGNSGLAARNNLIRQNARSEEETLEDAISNAAYKTLVDSANFPNANAPYSEVPNVGGYLGYDALVNPDAIVRNTSSNPNSLQTALESAAMSALTRDNPSTAISAYDSILNPDKVPYGLSGGLGDININAEGGSSDAEGGTGGRSSGGSGRGSALASGTGYMDISALYELLNQRLGEYDANYQSLLDSLNTNYADMLNALGLNYADTEALLNGQLNASRSELEDARRRQLQEAYISRMMQEKNLADQLDAYGLTGGASESVMADMRNNYANNRNAVEERVQNSLRDLLMNYLTNVTNARQRYNDSLLNAQNSRVSALNDAANYRSQARANAYEDLYNTLANLTMKGINYGS